MTNAKLYQLIENRNENVFKIFECNFDFDFTDFYLSPRKRIWEYRELLIYYSYNIRK